MDGRLIATSILTALLLLCGGRDARAQASAGPEFEAASLKPSAPTDGRAYTVGCSGGPGTKDPALYRCENISIANWVMTAYKINYFQFSGPDWMQNTRFDLQAKLPEGATKDQLSLMVQSLLADRFKLVVHHESREVTRYELVVAKNGPKFKEAAPKEEASSDAQRPGAFVPPALGKDGYPEFRPGRPGMAIYKGGKARMYEPEATMERLAGLLAGQLAKPVADLTGLKGKYDISLYWNSDTTFRLAAPGATASTTEIDSGPTLMQALQDQLGLRLESKKGPVDFVVVDHAEKVPSEN
jgi:uncharacterized protein (TIGR03435 family)